MRRAHFILFLFMVQISGVSTAEPNITPIDLERLASGEVDHENWISFGRDYSNQRFSPLTQINSKNIQRLVPKWIYQSGKKGSFQTQPLIADGVMYITLPGNDVVALDAENGRRLWQYNHLPRFKKTKGGPANRGAAIGHGKVFEATNDGRLIALDRATGAVVWDQTISKPRADELVGLTPQQQKIFSENIDRLPAKMAPLVLGDTVIVGVTSAGYGIFYNFDTGSVDQPPSSDHFLGQRGYMVAFDVHSGKEKWRWHTTKAEKWEGDFARSLDTGEILPRDIKLERANAEKYADRWRIGGSSTWMTPSYDPDLGLIFVGTGNASPNDLDLIRPGDNLYANSLVAIDVTTGETRWHYQQVPHDLWGYDVASTSVLFETTINDEKKSVIGIAGKTGWFYVHDRRSGELLYRSEPVVPQSNLFKAPSEEGILASPGSFGGVSWSPTSFNPNNNLLYVAGIHKPSRYFLRYGQYNGKRTPYIEYGLAKDQQSWGTLTALDTYNAGKIKWQVKTKLPLIGGVLATNGNLLFVGSGDGMFNAYNAENGNRLWQFNCGAGVNAPPVSYAINGKQLVAVAAGGHFLMGYPPGDALIAFGLAD